MYFIWYIYMIVINVFIENDRNRVDFYYVCFKIVWLKWNEIWLYSSFKFRDFYIKFLVDDDGNIFFNIWSKLKLYIWIFIFFLLFGCYFIYWIFIWWY